MVRRFAFLGPIVISLAILAILVGSCGRAKKEELAPTGKPNEQWIQERFAEFRDGFINQDVSKMMSIVASVYFDPFTGSKSGLRQWFENYFAQWSFASADMEIVSEITVTPGHAHAHAEPTPSSADFTEETTLTASHASEDKAISSVWSTEFTWELREEDWFITKIFGTMGTVEVSPASVSAGAEFQVRVYTVPFGKPLDDYDTQTASLKDWNNQAVSLTDLGNGVYQASLTAPGSSGTYKLTAVLSDSTWSRSVQVEYTLVIP